MKGCVFKRGKTYSIIIETGRDINGKRQQKWFSGYKSKKDAEKDMVKLLNQLETNTFINPEKITLAEYLKEWLSDYVKTRRLKGTRSMSRLISYRQSAKYRFKSFSLYIYRSSIRKSLKMGVLTGKEDYLPSPSYTYTGYLEKLSTKL